MSKELIETINASQWSVKEYIPKIINLIENGADINYKNPDSSYKNSTPLHHCATTGGFFPRYIQITKLLIENGADVHALNAEGLTPASNAIRTYALDIFEYLMKKGSEISNIKFQMILDQYCYEYGLDQEHNENSAYERLIGRMDILIKNGFNINQTEEDMPPILVVFISLLTNEITLPSKFITYLIKNDAEVKNLPEDILMQVIGGSNIITGDYIKNKDALRVIKSIGINFKFKNGYTAFLLNVAYNNIKLVKKLVDNDVEIKDDLDFAIELAEGKKYNKMIKYLNTLKE